MGSEKKISVVMCTYNGERFLREQLDSILNQTLLPVEIIVQDDGSTDSTYEILIEYAAKSSLIKPFKNDGVHGINSNFFRAMRRASANYIALCDQDDVWDVDKLLLQAESIGDKMLCSGFSVPFSTEGYPVSYDHRRPNYHILRVAYLGALHGHTFLIKKELLNYLPDGEHCPYLYDWQLQLVAAAAESIVFVDRTLVHFRRYEGAATANLPVDNRLVSRSTRQYITTTLFHHRELQAAVRERFAKILTLLDSLPFQTQAMKECREMALLQLHQGLRAYCKRTFFFVCQRRHLFYAADNRPILLWLRALYFAFSCGYYYRYVLKQKK